MKDILQSASEDMRLTRHHVSGTTLCVETIDSIAPQFSYIYLHEATDEMITAMRTSVSSTRSKIVCSSSTANHASDLSSSANRRAAMLGLMGGMYLIAAPGAKALIPDDDDEEMVLKARQNRKNKLAGERQAEKEFSRSEGFVDKNSKKNLAIVQLAVNALAKVGNALASGNVGEASGAAREIDAGVGAALQALSINSGASSAASTTAAELSALLGALNGGDLAAAKKEYVDVVVNLTEWAIKANIELKGV